MDLGSARNRAEHQDAGWQAEQIEYGQRKLQELGQRLRVIGSEHPVHAGTHSYTYTFPEEDGQPEVIVLINGRFNLSNERAISIEAKWQRGITLLGVESIDFSSVHHPTPESLDMISHLEDSLAMAEVAYEVGQSTQDVA